MHRTSVAALIGLAYGICTGVILAAYHEFGSPSLLKPPRVVVADPQPAQLLPEELMLDDTAAAGWQEAPMTELADAVPLTSPPGNAALTSPLGEIRPAMGGRPAAEPVSGIEISAASEAPDSARDAAGPGPSGDEPMPEEQSTAAAPETLETWVAAVPEMASELDAAVLPHAAAVAQVPGAAVALPPMPAFKPLALLPAVVAEAGPAAVLGASGASRGFFSRSRPPKPSMKPVAVASDALPEPARARDARAVTSKGQTLPDALRAFFTNLKILLASAPAPSEFRTGGGNGGAAIGSGRRAGSGGNSSPSSGAGASAGGGSSSVSSGDEGGSVSSGGGRGQSRSDGGRGRDDRDRDDDDRGSRGDDRGRGDGDRGGRGNGRGGDDDDDD